MTKYQKRISGPLLDRIDIHVEVPEVDYQKLTDTRLGESSEAIRARVEAARAIQRQRFAGLKGAGNLDIVCNADMGPAEVRKFCRLDDASSSLMKSAMSQLQLSARGYHRMLKLARTIAGLTGNPQIGRAHLAICQLGVYFGTSKNDLMSMSSELRSFYNDGIVPKE